MGKEHSKSTLVTVEFKPVHNIPEPHSKQFFEGNRSMCWARYPITTQTRNKSSVHVRTHKRALGMMHTKELPETTVAQVISSYVNDL